MNMNNYIVYMHKNKINNKCYIGLTKNKKNRWIPAKYKDSPLFYNAIQKYGWNNFEHIILHDNLTIIEAEQKEIQEIKIYNSNDRMYGYNLTNGGDGAKGIKHSEETKRILREKSKGNKNALGYKHTQEAIKKLSAANKGRIHSEEAREAMSLAQTGKKMPEHVKAILIKANTGIVRTEEQRQRMSEIKKGQILSKESKEKQSKSLKRKVKQIDKFTLKLIKIHDSAKDAGIELGISRSNITMCCRGQAKTAGGYIWEYAEPKNKNHK